MEFFRPDESEQPRPPVVEMNQETIDRLLAQNTIVRGNVEAKHDGRRFLLDISGMQGSIPCSIEPDGKIAVSLPAGKSFFCSVQSDPEDVDWIDDPNKTVAIIERKLIAKGFQPFFGAAILTEPSLPPQIQNPRLNPFRPLHEILPEKREDWRLTFSKKLVVPADAPVDNALDFWLLILRGRQRAMSTSPAQEILSNTANKALALVEPMSRRKKPGERIERDPQGTLHLDKAVAAFPLRVKVGTPELQSKT